MTNVLKDAILKAAEKAGDGDIVAYLTKQANDNPASFMTLLGKVLPMQIGGDPGNPIEHTISDLRYLSDEELTAIVMSGHGKSVSEAH